MAQRAQLIETLRLSSFLLRAKVISLTFLALLTFAAAPHVIRYAVRLVLASHPDNPRAPESVKRYSRYGASPRGVAGAALVQGDVPLSRQPKLVILKVACRHSGCCFLHFHQVCVTTTG